MTTTATRRPRRLSLDQVFEVPDAARERARAIVFMTLVVCGLLVLALGVAVLAIEVG